MVREDILGGLRTALARGQTLKQAMVTFYNAGYLKQEIEDAAKFLIEQRDNPTLPQFTQAVSKSAPIFQRGEDTSIDPNEKPKEIFSQTAKLPPKQIQQQSTQVIQKVSAYGDQTNFTQKTQIQNQSQSAPVVQKVSSYGPQSIEKNTLLKQPIQQSQQQPQTQQPQQPQPIQKVSAYGISQQAQQVKPKGKAIIFILLALLIILIIGLVALFFFKQEILAFFESV